MLNVPVLLVLLGVCYGMRDQSIAVRGKLVCGAKPASNVRVKLWEEDTGPDPDDLLDSGYTDANGEFRLSGGTAELTPIDPILKVYHGCDDGFKSASYIRRFPGQYGCDHIFMAASVYRGTICWPGKRKVKFYIPKSYITSGKIPKKEFDVGVLNLETIFPKEERELIVSRRRRHRKSKMELDDDSGSSLLYFTIWKDRKFTNSIPSGYIHRLHLHNTRFSLAGTWPAFCTHGRYLCLQRCEVYAPIRCAK
ncbi:hypothetical protein Y032_0010g957 [Ancylostoma ceylanicum]|nr:hypothetical protein Y032_0010g957 [Ancylostoma ceylanicum]